MGTLLAGPEQEETVLDIRIANAKRDAGDLSELLQRCRSEAMNTGKVELAQDIGALLNLSKALRRGLEDVQEEGR